MCVFVKPEVISMTLNRSAWRAILQKYEETMHYPGQIKVKFFRKPEPLTTQNKAYN
jgi:hypothetical protein